MTIITEQRPTESPTIEPSPAPTWEDFQALEERVDKRGTRFAGWTMFIWSFAAVALVFSMIAIGFGFRAMDDAKHTARAGASSSGAAGGAPQPTAALGPVTLSDFKVQTGASTVSPGTVNLQITNTGKVQHELLVFRSTLAPSAYPTKDGNIDEEAAGITKTSDGDNLDPGATQSRSIDLTQPGTYLFVCNLAGHFKAGMFSVVTVK